MLQERELRGGPRDDLGTSVGASGVGKCELDDRSIVHIVGDDVEVSRDGALLEPVDSKVSLSVDRDSQCLVVTDSVEESSPQDIGWADVVHARYHESS